MLPHAWVRLSPRERTRVALDGRQWLRRFEERLAELWVHAESAPPTGSARQEPRAPGPARQEPRAPGSARQEPRAPVSGLLSPVAWLAHVKLFGTYFRYHLRRLEAFSEMRDIVEAYRGVPATPGGLPEPFRQRLIALHQEIQALAEQYDREAAAVPGHMMERTRAHQMTWPFREWVGGYDPSLDALLEVPQFAGILEVEPTEVPAGREFVLRVRLRNTGVHPWIPGVSHRLAIAGGASRVGLPERWDYEGAPMAFGDRRVVELRGTAPEGTGEAKLMVSFASPFRNPHTCAKQEITLRWR